MSTSHAAPRRARSRRRARSPWTIVGWSALGVVLVLVACGAWIGIRGLAAASDLQKSQALASTVQKQLVAGDAAAASKTAAELRDRVHSARDLTSDPIWRAAELVPGAGVNLSAVRQVSSLLSSVTDQAVVPLAQVAGTLDVASFKPVNGALDLKPLIAAQPAVERAAQAMRRAEANAAAIPTTGTIGQVHTATSQLTAILKKAATATDAVDRAMKLLPPMLGDATPRTYLVLFQNNAELRASGGNPGALALLSVQGGRISMVQQANSGDFPHYPGPVLPLPVETAGLYGNITGEYIQDVTLTPHFALSAALAQEMWKRQYGTTVDGVLSVDPVTLGYLLQSTGPITLPTGDQLTSGNAVKTLLSDVYARYTVPAQQDLFFGAAAAAVFQRVAHGDFAPKTMLAALAKAGDEHRVLLWSAHPEEQKLLAQTTLAGGLPVSSPSASTFGIYLNDATGAKMDYYLHMSVGLGQATCRKDGRPNVGVTVTFTNSAPGNASTTLTDYVTGGGNYGVQPGDVKTQVAVYAPPGFIFLRATRGGAGFGLQSASDSGHAVAQFPVSLKPGESATVSLEFLGDSTSKRGLAAATTPLLTALNTSSLAITCK